MFKGFSWSSEHEKNSGYGGEIGSSCNPPGPPPYSEKDKLEEKATTDARQDHENYVQLCPHERLSFARFQRIQDLLHKGEEKRLDALSARPTHHSGMQSVESFESRFSSPPEWDVYQICKPDKHTSEPALVQGQAAYMGINDGLELLSIWKIEFSNRQFNQEAFTKIQNLLEPFHVRLCPHRSLHDEAVVTKLVSMVAPRFRDPDPLRRFEKNEQLRRCPSCESMFEFQMQGSNLKTCTVTITREIKGINSDDASWLRHCSRTDDRK